MTGHKYLVAVDGSQEAQNALEWAVTHSTKDDLILIVTIIERVFFEPSHEQIKEQIISRAKAVLQKSAAFCKSNGVHCKPYLIDEAASIREEVLAQVDNKHADFLVVGNRGLGALERTSVGSVSDYVVRYSSVPVVVVKYGSIL